MARKSQLGYWLVSDGNQGFGVVYSNGNPASKLGANAKAVFVGTTLASIRSGILSKGGSITPAFGEVDVNATASQAYQHKLAWFTHTPGGAVPTSDLTYLAASVGAGGELAGALRSILGAADVESDVAGSGGSASAPKALEDGAGSDSDAAADASNNSEDGNPSKSELTAKALNIGALTLSGPALIRILEVVGGVILLVMAAREFSGRSGTSVVVQTAKVGAKAAAGAALA